MTRILSKRILKILPQVIKSKQSCAISGANICSSALNILSFIEAVEKSGKCAAILSVDMFKAYDRVNLSYCQKVLLAMQFPPKFIDWILCLHRGAQTRLLLDNITDAIDVLFSVRQGDPLSTGMAKKTQPKKTRPKKPKKAQSKNPTKNRFFWFFFENSPKIIQKKAKNPIKPNKPP